MNRTRSLGVMVAAVLAASVLSAGGAVWASHQFPDVPDVGYHDQIGNIVDAGCASGFNDGTFKPQNPTTRGQFAYWTDNCGSQVHEAGTDTAQPVGPFPDELLAVDIVVNGATPGATQFVRVDAVATFGCAAELLGGAATEGNAAVDLLGIGPEVVPGSCNFEFGIVEDPIDEPTLVHSHTIIPPSEGGPAPIAPSGTSSIRPTGGGGSGPMVTATVSASKVFELAPGEHTLYLAGYANTDTANAFTFARSITASIAPFGSSTAYVPPPDT